MGTIEELTEMIRKIGKALEICDDTEDNCQGCPYHKYGDMCRERLDKDTRMTLGRIVSVPVETAPVPENLGEMIDKNEQAWEEWADELQKARVKQLEQENTELKAKLDSVYNEKLKDLTEKQSKLRQELH